MYYGVASEAPKFPTSSLGITLRLLIADADTVAHVAVAPVANKHIALLALRDVAVSGSWKTWQFEWVNQPAIFVTSSGPGFPRFQSVVDLGLVGPLGVGLNYRRIVSTTDSIEVMLRYVLLDPVPTG